MLTQTLAATAALSMLAGGGSALAQSKSSVTAAPKQPIPYSQLDAYMKASPKARASKDWWAGSTSAATGTSTDTAATAPGSAMSGSSTRPSTDTSVNPPASSAPGLPSTPPTDGGTQPNGSTMPNPNTPGDTTGAPTEPK